MKSNTQVIRELAGNPWLLPLTFLAGGVWFLRNYFHTDSVFWLGCCIIPYVSLPNREVRSVRYLPAFLLFGVLLFFVPAKSVFFFALLSGILFAIESRVGKVSWTFIILLFVISPVCKYLCGVIGIPLRLWLSLLSGKILALLGMPVHVAGNMIFYRQQEFSVDPACAGLGMLQVSLVIGLFMLAWFQRKNGRELSLRVTLLFLIGLLVFNLLANLIRILLLICFGIMPENPMHEVVGIAGLIGYVVLPAFFLGQVLFRYLSREKEVVQPAIRAIPMIGWKGFPWMLALLLMLLGMCMPPDYERPVDPHFQLTGYRKEALRSGILKFTRSGSLVYVKSVNYFSPEHNPMICWTSSGYVFKYINREKLYGYDVATGILEHDGDSIYTAWWFDDGTCKTADQWEWRWKAFRGRNDFNLVNVNASDTQSLLKAVREVIQSTPAKPISPKDTEEKQTARLR